jgi:hypothetical protein
VLWQCDRSCCDGELELVAMRMVQQISKFHKELHRKSASVDPELAKHVL